MSDLGSASSELEPVFIRNVGILFMMDVLVSILIYIYIAGKYYLS